MKRSFITVLKDGRDYAKVWPHHSVTAAFTESRVIPVTRLGERWTPAIAAYHAVIAATGGLLAGVARAATVITALKSLV